MPAPAVGKTYHVYILLATILFAVTVVTCLCDYATARCDLAFQFGDNHLATDRRISPEDPNGRTSDFQPKPRPIRAPWVYPSSNLASDASQPHNAGMPLTEVFIGFLQPVAVGSVAVFALLVAIGLKTPRRSPALATRRISR